MKFDISEIVSCDVLVIGGGGAGLRSAIAAASSGARVLVVSKARIGRSTNTFLSKAVIAASGWGVPDDNAEVHARDTVEGGRFLNDISIVTRIAEQAKSEVAFLRDCGVRFDMENDRPRVMQTPGHRYARHVYGENWVGRDLVFPLMRHAAKKGVDFMAHVFVSRLLVSGNRISGAAGISRDNRFIVFKARAVVLATGGYAQIYLNTNNAPGITGDGQALAYEAGVGLKDMEFVQFYPTARGRRGSRLFLYEKMLAQKGVALKTDRDEDILKANGISDPLSVTRDQLAQIMMKATRGQFGCGPGQEEKDTPILGAGNRTVWMDLASLSEDIARKLTPLLPKAYWWKGQKRFNVMPTTHFCMGGVVIGHRGQTSLQGLFAVGEVTAGAHGANRLGGNALAEIFTMGSRVGETAGQYAMQAPAPALIEGRIEDEKRRLERLFHSKGVHSGRLIEELKTIMWHKAGIIRNKIGLQAALEQISGHWPRAAITDSRGLIAYLEFENMRLVAEMVGRAALLREESRGSHFRTDFSSEDNVNWLRNIVIHKGSTGLELGAVAVPQSKK